MVALLALSLLVSTVCVFTASASAESVPYRIGTDDVLAVSVWDQKDLEQMVFVRPDGKISLPLLGEVQAGGRTVEELTDTLTILYSQTVKDARVTVTVREIRSRAIFFVGGVGSPGPMQLTQELTLLQAISMAGGVTPTSDLEAAFVLRGDRRIPVDFTRLVQRADLTQNITLQPGDTIVVPVGEVVFVQGEVKNPGTIKFASDLTMIKAIVLSGGFTAAAASKQVTLIRESGGGRKENISVNVSEMIAEPQKAADMPLKPNDIVIVPPGLTEVVYIQGEVKTPGQVTFVNGLTVMKAIAQSGGFTPAAAANQVTLTRADGVKKETFSINGSDRITEPNQAADMPLKPNDIVMVPPRPTEVVFVQGEVKTPGTVGFLHGLTVIEAIARTGGLTQGAAPKRVTVTRVNGAKKETIKVNLKKMMSRPDKAAPIVLQPNDIIVVPQRRF